MIRKGSDVCGPHESHSDTVKMTVNTRRMNGDHFVISYCEPNMLSETDCDRIGFDKWG